MSADSADNAGHPRKILGRASIVAAGTAFQQGISFASGLIIARVLGAADYGIFNLARNLMEVTGILTRLGLDVGLQRRFGEARAASDVFGSLVTLRRVRMLSSGLALLPVIAVGMGLGRVLEDNVYQYDGFAEILLVLALALPFLTDISVLGGAYRGKLQLAPSVLTESVLLPSLRLLIIIGLFIAGWRLWAVVAGTTIASFVAAAVLLLRARRDFPPVPRHETRSWQDTRSVVSYSAVLAVGVLVATLTSTMDILVLGRFADAEALGQYSLAKTLLLLMGVFGIAFAQGLGSLVAERFRRDDIDGVVEVMSLTARWITLGTLPVFAVFLFWGADLVLLFGESFAIAQPVIAWLAFAQFLFSVLGPAGWALSMTGKQLLELKTLTVGLATAAVVCLYAVPLYGQLGAAVATCMSVGIAHVTRLLFVRRHLGRFPFAPDLLVISASGLLLALVLDRLIAYMALPAMWSGLLATGVFAVAYVALAWLFLLRDFERAGIQQVLGSTRQFLFCKAG
jgi:O-antigen/teichoic acid export membrane protein